MKTELDVQRVVARVDIPPDQDFQDWVECALAGRGHGNSLTIRIVDKVESQRLNAEYRGRAVATNVLSFGADLPGEVAGALRDAGAERRGPLHSLHTWIDSRSPGQHPGFVRGAIHPLGGKPRDATRSNGILTPGNVDARWLRDDVFLEAGNR